MENFRFLAVFSIFSRQKVTKSLHLVFFKKSRRNILTKMQGAVIIVTVAGQSQDTIYMCPFGFAAQYIDIPPSG